MKRFITLLAVLSFATASMAQVPALPAPAVAPAPVATPAVAPAPVAPAVAPAPAPAPKRSVSTENGFQGINTLGITFSGYYEVNSDLESLYVSFPANDINTGGFGIYGYYEKGLTDNFSAELNLGYNRLLYSSKFSGTIKENFFNAEVNGHYFFVNNSSLGLYGIFGAGALVSGSSVAPVANIGVGNYFKLAKDFSIKTEFLVKSAVILNRAEGRVGLAYHF